MFARVLKRWEISASTGSHFDVLDGLRGVAILLVVSLHTLYTNPSDGLIAWLINYGIIQSGWMGVPIFFVLSGFLISYPFFQQRLVDVKAWYVRGYARRRMAKILPPFYLSIVIFILFYWWQFHDPAYLSAAWKWAVGIPNFVLVTPQFNSPYWSLIVEAQFYIILPLLFWLTRGLPLKQTTILIFFILFAAPVIARLFLWDHGNSVPTNWNDEQLARFDVRLVRFPVQLDYFGYGVVFAGIYAALRTLREPVRILGVFGYVGILLLIFTLFLWSNLADQFDIQEHPTRWSVELAHFLPGFSAFMLLFFVFDPQSLGSRLLSFLPLRFVGIVSFEWFLLHVPVVGWFRNHTHGAHTHGNWLAYGGKVVLPLMLTFALAVLMYRYFSLPILNRVRAGIKKQS